MPNDGPMIGNENVLRVLVLVGLAATFYRFGSLEPKTMGGSASDTEDASPATQVVSRLMGGGHNKARRTCPPVVPPPPPGVTTAPAKALACPAGRLLKFHKNYKKFILNTFKAVNNAITPRHERPLQYIFSPSVWPTIYETVPKDGLVLEFGVFYGDTLAYTYKTLAETGFQGYVGGFDSFAGLPTKWRNGFDAGHFGDGQYPSVKRRFKNTAVNLHKGWFQETLPAVLEEHPDLPITHLHVDGDLFVSAVIPLQILTERIRVGSLITFDELFNYPEYEQHEILALYLWMGQTGAELCAVANRNKVSVLKPKGEINGLDQSATFQVAKI